jgi:hypothetical protein
MQCRLKFRSSAMRQEIRPLMTQASTTSAIRVVVDDDARTMALLCSAIETEVGGRCSADQACV